jgi:Tfp pilus assembly PilM family ATPase
VPAKAQDLDQLVRWQVRKTAPFPIEEAQVSYVPGLRAEDGQEFLVSLARRSVVEEYEGLLAEAGAHAGLVDLSTFNVINAVLAGAAPPSADWLLVNVAADYTTIVLLRGPHLIFFRNRVADTEGTLLDLVHQTTMYYEDRLQGAGFSRAILSGGDGDMEELRHSIEERVKSPVDLIDPTGAAALTDRITAAPTLLGTLAPLVGLLLRDRERASA